MTILKVFDLNSYKTIWIKNDHVVVEDGEIELKLSIDTSVFNGRNFS